MVDGDLQQIRRICLAFPEASERWSHGAPTCFVREKKTFASYWEDHHRIGRPAVWCPAPYGAQTEMIEAEPDRFFAPPYVGGRGWLGIWLDVEVDWEEVAGIVDDAYRQVAPKKLVEQMDGEP